MDLKGYWSPARQLLIPYTWSLHHTTILLHTVPSQLWSCRFCGGRKIPISCRLHMVISHSLGQYFRSTSDFNGFLISLAGQCFHILCELYQKYTLNPYLSIDVCLKALCVQSKTTTKNLRSRPYGPKRGTKLLTDLDRTVTYSSFVTSRVLAKLVHVTYYDVRAVFALQYTRMGY